MGYKKKCQPFFAVLQYLFPLPPGHKYQALCLPGGLVFPVAVPQLQHLEMFLFQQRRNLLRLSRVFAELLPIPEIAIPRRMPEKINLYFHLMLQGRVFILPDAKNRFIFPDERVIA